MFGLGLRPAHYEAIVDHKPNVDFFEIMTDDFIHQNGVDFFWLEKIREHYSVSLHGVSLSIGSIDPVNQNYLQHLSKLIDHVQPISVSDHFCWTGVNEINTHDLLPLPFSHEAMRHLVSRIQIVQEFLKQPILLENISSYLTFKNPEMSEWEFIAEIAKRSGCFILLDINNVYVNAFNHGFSVMDYFQGMPADRVKQFHLAGHQHCQTHLIDTHDAAVNADVWDCYAKARVLFPDAHVVIERDAHIPPLEELLKELEMARKMGKSREC